MIDQPALVPWGSIELLHNVVKTLQHYAELGQPLPRVTYRAKVKLHGSNCAVQTLCGGATQAQSRSTLLTPQDDFKGFAAFVASSAQMVRWPEGMVVYGEWCGPGVERGMAVSKLPEKIFAVFSVRDRGRMVVDPPEIAALLSPLPPGVHVIPWEGEPFEVDFADRARLEQVARSLDEAVQAVERQDPFVLSTFGVSGLGEGLVLYPVGVSGAPCGDPTARTFRPPPGDPESYQRLMWKAKGERHRTVQAPCAAQVDPTAVASAEAFADLTVTPARLHQGLTEACGGQRDPRLTGKFLSWVAQDVRKECQAELAASNLPWDKVERTVQSRARAWFLGKDPAP